MVYFVLYAANLSHELTTLGIKTWRRDVICSTFRAGVVTFDLTLRGNDANSPLATKLLSTKTQGGRVNSNFFLEWYKNI